MKHAKIIPPDIADNDVDTSFTDWLNTNGVLRAAWNGQQWNVYLVGGRFTTGPTIEEALISIGAEA